MKPVIKYISLLLFSGLILPFSHHLKNKPAATLVPNKAAAAKVPGNNQNAEPMYYFSLQGIIEYIIPALKK